MPPGDFLSLSLAELSARLASRPRALAARRWLYAARPLPAALPERIPGVAPGPWAALRGSAPLPEHRVVARQVSEDGVVKLAVELAGATAETVLIPGPGRSTVCLSSQAGCSRACSFCATAELGFRRSLTAGEIVLQYALAAAEAPAGAPARNVVFMGMGEPMDNLDAVLDAIARLTEESQPRLAARHVTVSTSGVLPGIERFLGASRANLALSLNATTDAQRERLIPHNRQWPIAALLGALRVARERDPERDCFVEYVLIAGVNDSGDDARRLAGLLSGVVERVNLIPHNAWAGSALASPGPDVVERFVAELRAAGLRPLVRRPRGQDVAAACGQLALGRG